MKDASMSLGIYFEIKDAELYGGEGTTGYAATIVEISIEGLQNADFEKYADSQLEAMASMDEDGRRQAPVPTQQRDIYIQRPGSRAETFGRSHQAQDPRPWNQ